MANDAPSHLPPVLRPDDPPVHTLEDLAARFARETRGDLSGATLTGLTLATADLRPGDVFVAVRGVNRHGAEFAAAAAEKGAVAVVTDAEGADIAEATGLPIIVVDDPRGVLGDLSAWVYGTGRDDDLPILFGDHRHQRQDERLAPARGHPRPARGGHGAVLHGRTPHRRTGHRVPPHDARGIRDARPARPDARTRRGGRGRRGERAGTQPPPRGRHHVRRRRVHQPHARPPRRLRRHARVLRGEAAAVPARSRPSRGHLPRLRGRRPRWSRAARCPVVTVGTPAIAADPGAAADADWVVEILEERQTGTEFRLTSSDGRSLTTVVPVIGRHMAANAGLAIVMILEAGYAWERIIAALERDGGIERVPARSYRARLGRARTRRLRRLRPLPRRVREDARRGPPGDPRAGC